MELRGRLLAQDETLKAEIARLSESKAGKHSSLEVVIAQHRDEHQEALRSLDMELRAEIERLASRHAADGSEHHERVVALLNDHRGAQAATLEERYAGLQADIAGLDVRLKEQLLELSNEHRSVFAEVRSQFVAQLEQRDERQKEA